MLKIIVSYTRYTLSMLATVGFGSSVQLIIRSSQPTINKGEPIMLKTIIQLHPLHPVHAVHCRLWLPIN